MATVTQHYAAHLAPVYEWLAGGCDAAVTRAEAELAAMGVLQQRGLAVDLGAGFGAHAIALARAGHTVVAIDSSPLLLERLRQGAQALAVTVIEADLASFAQQLQRPADLILCMGDTLTHLPDAPAVERLLREVAGSLANTGTFVATFRDYHTVTLTGERRFIPARSDEQRILTCFLDYQADHVLVHDLLYERREGQWMSSVSAYPKLRLAPGWLCSVLESCGLSVQQGAGPGGMVRIVASRSTE